MTTLFLQEWNEQSIPAGMECHSTPNLKKYAARRQSYLELQGLVGESGWMSEKLVKVLKKSLKFDNICINAASIVLKLSDFLTILSGNIHMICID